MSKREIITLARGSFHCAGLTLWDVHALDARRSSLPDGFRFGSVATRLLLKLRKTESDARRLRR